MILKLGMKHQAMELYKVCINHDPGMTLTYFMARSTQVVHAFVWGKLLKYHLKVKTCKKWADGQNIYVYEKKCPPGVCLPLPRGYVHVHDLKHSNIICSESARPIKAKLYVEDY